MMTDRNDNPHPAQRAKVVATALGAGATAALVGVMAWSAAGDDATVDTRASSGTDATTATTASPTTTTIRSTTTPTVTVVPTTQPQASTRGSG